MENILDRMDFKRRLKEYEGEPAKLGTLIAEAQYETGNEIAEIKEHLEQVNGTVAQLKQDQMIIQMNQNILLSRFWNCLPSWVQKAVIIWLALSILLVPALGSLTAVLSIMLTT